MSKIPDDRVTLGEAINWARNQRRMTLRALASAIEVSPAFLSDVEHDRRNTTKLEEIAKILDVDVADLRLRDGRLHDLTEWLQKNPELAMLLRDLRAHRCRKLILKAKDWK